MNFKLDDNSLEKSIYIFDDIGKILNIDLNTYMYEDKKDDLYLKTKASNQTYFRKNKDKKNNTIPVTVQFSHSPVTVTVQP